MARVILDASPLVAYLDRRQTHHHWVTEVFDGLTEPVSTCEAAIVEACFLLRMHVAAIGKIEEYLKAGVIYCDFALGREHTRVFALMRKYRDVPMSLADACLVRMAELHDGAQVFTLDSDFRTYRMNRTSAVPLIAPFAQRG
jgi:uncharacterized protein